MGAKGNEKKNRKYDVIFWIVAIVIIMVLTFGKNEEDTYSDNNAEKTSRQEESHSEKESNDKSKKDSKPEPVKVEDSQVLYYMDLYNNYEDYDGKYVTVSAPVHYAKDDTVDIKGDIEGATGMINITLLDPRNDLSEGDYITVTGRIDGKSLGYLYMKDANISATGGEPAEIYNQQKSEYDEIMQQNAEVQKGEFINSCQKYEYEELVRYPDTYKDNPIRDTLIIEQVMPGCFLSSEGYRCYEVGTENEIVITDEREVKEPKFIEGDAITVYGTYYGTTEMKRLLTGERISIPCIEFQYADFN